MGSGRDTTHSSSPGLHTARKATRWTWSDRVFLVGETSFLTAFPGRCQDKIAGALGPTETTVKTGGERIAALLCSREGSAAAPCPSSSSHDASTGSHWQERAPSGSRKPTTFRTRTRTSTMFHLSLHTSKKDSMGQRTRRTWQTAGRRSHDGDHATEATSHATCRRHGRGGIDAPEIAVHRGKPCTCHAGGTPRAPGGDVRLTQGCSK